MYKFAIKILYLVEFPIFFFPISFCIILFYLLKVGLLIWTPLVFIFILLECLFTRTIIRACRLKRIFGVCELLIFAVLMVLIAAILFFYFFDKNNFLIIGSIYCISMNFVSKVFLMYMHAGKIFPPEYLNSKVKFARFFDWDVPEKIRIDVVLVLLFWIIFATLFHICSLVPILLFPHGGYEDFSSGDGYLSFLLFSPLFSYVYYPATSYLIVFRGNLNQYFTE